MHITFSQFPAFTVKLDTRVLSFYAWTLIAPLLLNRRYLFILPTVYFFYSKNVCIITIPAPLKMRIEQEKKDLNYLTESFDL